MDERSETDRINDLEAWAFRAGRDLAEIKGELKLKSTVSAVDALHRDVRDVAAEVDEGFAAVNQRLDTLTSDVAGVKDEIEDVQTELATQRGLLEEILRRLPAAQAD